MKHCKYLSLKFVLINGKKTNLVRSLSNHRRTTPTAARTSVETTNVPLFLFLLLSLHFAVPIRAWAERSRDAYTTTSNCPSLRTNFQFSFKFRSWISPGTFVRIGIVQISTVRTCTCPTVYVTVACDLSFWHTILPGNKPHAQDRRDAHYESGVLFGFTLFSNGTSENTENERGTRDSGGSYKAIGWAARNTRRLLNQSQKALYVFHWSSTETSHCFLDHKNWWLLAFTDRLLILRSLTLSVNQIKENLKWKDNELSVSSEKPVACFEEKLYQRKPSIQFTSRLRRIVE